MKGIKIVSDMKCDESLKNFFNGCNNTPSSGIKVISKNGPTISGISLILFMPKRKRNSMSNCVISEGVNGDL